MLAVDGDKLLVEIHNLWIYKHHFVESMFKILTMCIKHIHHKQTDGLKKFSQSGCKGLRAFSGFILYQ